MKKKLHQSYQSTEVEEEESPAKFCERFSLREAEGEGECCLFHGCCSTGPVKKFLSLLPLLFLVFLSLVLLLEPKA